jgi:CMP-N-acetylneuraminic acid synthetase
MKTTAVIAARKGSERIPSKMFQEINGESLIMRKIRQLRNVHGIQEIVVGTDADNIKQDIIDAGAIFARMPDEFCQGRNPNGMIKNALSFFDSDQVLWAHPTNPLIETKHYQEALDALQEVKCDGYDSLFSVNQLNGHFWNQQPSPINFSPTAPVHKIAAQLPPIYVQNGGIFIRPYKAMAEDGLFISGKAFMFPMCATVGWDVDLPWELEFARFLAKNKELVN